MQAVAQRCNGTHDFSAFCTHAHEVETVCTGTPVRVGAEGFSLIYEIAADRFVDGMVGLVGTMVDIGRGKIAGGGVRGILASGDRRRRAAQHRQKVCFWRKWGIRTKRTRPWGPVFPGDEVSENTGGTH